MKPLLIALIFLASCTKEVARPIPISAPNNRPVPQTVTVRLYKFQQWFGASWVLEVTHNKILMAPVKVTIAWKDDNQSYVIPVTTPAGFRQTSATIVPTTGFTPAKGEARDVRMIEAEGEKNIFYTLNYIP